MKKAVRQSYQNSKQNFNTPEICKEHDDLVREFQSLKRYKKCSFEQITIENNIARYEIHALYRCTFNHWLRTNLTFLQVLEF